MVRQVLGRGEVLTKIERVTSIVQYFHLKTCLQCSLKGKHTCVECYSHRGIVVMSSSPSVASIYVKKVKGNNKSIATRPITRMKPRWRIFSLLLYYLLFKSRPLNSVMKMELLKSPCENLSDHGRLPFNSIMKSETSSRLISIENKKVSFFCLLRLWCKYQRQWLHVNRPERCTHVCKKDGSGVLWCAASNEESKNSCWKWRQSCSLKIDEVSFKADREREKDHGREDFSWV